MGSASHQLLVKWIAYSKYNIPDEGAWDIGITAEVPRGIKGEGGMGMTAVGIETVALAAEVKESPSRGFVSCGRARCGGLQEISAVQWGGFRQARKNDEELEEDSCTQDYEGQKSKNRAFGWVSPHVQGLSRASMHVRATAIMKMVRGWAEESL